MIEAAACGVPALASRIYGLADAVEDNVTGILHPVKDVAAIRQGLETLAADRQLLATLALAAQLRVERQFSEGVLVCAMRDFYQGLSL